MQRSVNRQAWLRSRPNGIPQAHDFDVRGAASPPFRTANSWAVSGLRRGTRSAVIVHPSRRVGGYDSITHITSEEGTMKGIVAQKGPFAVELEAGKTYYWCACGASKHQPFCDGSHKGTAFTPQAHTARRSGNCW